MGRHVAAEKWTSALHPRDRNGEFARGLAHARRHGEVEHDVFRSPAGKAVSVNRGERRVAELKATARHKQSMEDRTGQRLRFGEQAKGHWYMIKGPQYWVKSDGKPGWHNGYYYWPGRPFPVTPPREDWESRTSYNGYPSTATTPGTPLSHVVPDDVLQAAQMYKDDRVGKRMVGAGADRTVKGERFAARRARASVDDQTDRPKTLSVRKVGKKKTAAQIMASKR